MHSKTEDYFFIKKDVKSIESDAEENVPVRRAVSLVRSTRLPLLAALEIRSRLRGPLPSAVSTPCFLGVAPPGVFLAISLITNDCFQFHNSTRRWLFAA